MNRVHAVIFVLIVATTSCHHGSEPSQNPTGSQGFRMESATGWFHGSCLAIGNPNLARGTSIELVVMGEPQNVLQGQVGDKVSSAASCAPLIESRRSQNAKAGTSFYGLEGTKLSATDMGIGIVGTPQKITVVNGTARTDLNSDGRPEVFSSCATAEGINFAIWTENRFQGTPLWSGYYYLGYDMKPTCP